MAKLFPQSGVHSIPYHGTYNFNNGRLFLPEVSVLPSTGVPVGSIFHVIASGKIAVATTSSGAFDTFTLTNFAVPLTPDSISDLAFWYKAESGTQFTASVSEDQPAENGQPVFLWKDSGPHSKDADALAGMEPNWVVNGGGAGIDVVQFGGSHLFNVSGVATSLCGGSDAQLTMFALVKFVDDSTNQNIFGAGNSSTSVPAWTFRGRVDGGGGSDNIMGSRKSDDLASVVTAESPAEASSFNTSGLYLYQWRTADGTGQSLSMWQNGSGIIQTAAFDVGTVTFDRFSFGGNQRTSAEPSLFANVVELFAYSGSISGPSRTGIQMYIQNKYGVIMSGT